MSVHKRLARLISTFAGASVIAAVLLVASPVARAATCASSVGPGIPPPNGPTFGNAGFHAAWFGQSGYMSLCAGTESTATVAFYNTGSRGWVSGPLGAVAYLATWNPIPGQDRPSILGGDGTQGSPDTGWPRFNRLAIQPANYVGPGQVAWFQFRVRAPATPGRYAIALRPVIEGTTWMEDYGVFWNVTVLNPDGTPPVPPATRDPLTPIPDGYRVQIPRLSIDLPITEGDITRDTVDQRTPENFAFHLPTTSIPGLGGNTYIYSHARVGMFLNLWNAELGDEVYISTPDLKALRYVVTEVHPRIAPDDVSWMRDTPGERLTIQTSTGPYPTDPRFVVIAVPGG
jgi:LPXTG-site transpeptidase (sortase) family protein